MLIPLTLRREKGDELTWDEGDDNFEALRQAILAGGGSGADVDLPFITTQQFYDPADGSDYRPAIQRAINTVEASGIRQEIRISSPIVTNTHLLRSHYPIGDLPPLAAGERHALVIRKPNLVKIVGAKNNILIDTSVTAMRGIDALLGVIPDTDAEANELHLESLRLLGAAEGSPMNLRPKYIIKGNYRRLRYSRFYDIHMSVCSEDVFFLTAFVIHMTHCRARFAGLNGTGFHLRQGSLDAGGGAMTGYLLENCTVDYAGLHGVWMEGVSGHTYCQLDNVHVDFIGLDESQVTIGANVNASSGYKFEDVRGVNMIACGAEFCTRPLILRNARTFSVDTLYCLGMGRTDGVETLDFIRCSQFFEQVSLKRIENRSPRAGGFNCLLKLELPNQFNTNSVEVDSTISRDQIIVSGIGGNPYVRSSKPSLVTTENDFYDSHTRRPGGAALLEGKPMTGGVFNFWLNHETRAARNSWKFNTPGPTADVNFALLQILNLAQDGTVFFEFDIYIGAALVGFPARHRLRAYATRLSPGTPLGDETIYIEQIEGKTVPKVGTGGGEYGLSAFWSVVNQSQNIYQLNLKCTTGFAGIYIEGVAWGRTATQTQHFYWV